MLRLVPRPSALVLPSSASVGPDAYTAVASVSFAQLVRARHLFVALCTRCCQRRCGFLVSHRMYIDWDQSVQSSNSSFGYLPVRVRARRTSLGI